MEILSSFLVVSSDYDADNMNLNVIDGLKLSFLSLSSSPKTILKSKRLYSARFPLRIQYEKRCLNLYLRASIGLKIRILL